MNIKILYLNVESRISLEGFVTLPCDRYKVCVCLGQYIDKIYV